MRNSFNTKFKYQFKTRVNKHFEMNTDYDY